MQKKIFLLFIFLLCMSLSSWTPASHSDRESKYILKQIKKSVASTFSFESFSIDQKEQQLILSPFLEAYSFYDIIVEEAPKGYVMVATAPSKTDSFEYLLLFDLNYKIKKVKVLIYRENYGGEISSKRLLSQFLKSDQNDSFVYGDNISAISGATISVKSITSSINYIMDSIKKLKSQNQI